MYTIKTLGNETLCTAMSCMLAREYASTMSHKLQKPIYIYNDKGELMAIYHP